MPPFSNGLQGNNNGLKGNTPISQKMNDKQGNKNFVTLSLSSGGNQQGSSAQPNIYTFPIRPEQFTLDWPARQTVTQTINGAYQDHWGNGIGQIQLAGHTGWRQHGESQEDGFKRFITLRKMHDDYCQQCGDGDPANVHLELTVTVPDGFGHYRVSSDRFRTLKSTQSPLLYRYEIQFTVIEDLGSNTGSGSTQQSGTFNNGVAGSGNLTNAASNLTSLTNQFNSVADALLPQQTYQYVVQTNDSLTSISQKLLGSPAYVPLILRNNTGISSNQDLTAGQIINIPVLGTIA